MSKPATGYKQFVATRQAFSVNHSEMPYTEFVKIPPREFIHIDPEHDRAIIMPWLSTGARWQELRYSLRSIHEFFADKDCPIYVLCDKRPSWLNPGGRLRVVEMPGYSSSTVKGLREAWEFGCQIANEVAWWNDDIYLLKTTGWEDMRVALSEGDISGQERELRSSAYTFHQNLGDAVAELRLAGHNRVMRFATHTPYLFEADKAREIAATYHLPFYGAFETLYYNHHGTQHVPVGKLRVNSLPCDKLARYLNHDDEGPDPETRSALEKMFAQPAPWEVFATAPAIVSGAIPALVSLASFPPRAEGLSRVVSDILPQCDGLRIYLNGYDSIPDFMPNDPRITIILAGPGSEHPDIGSHGKWHWLAQEDCHYLTIDDDIFYHAGYVEHLVAACKRLNDKAIVGLHGYRFRGIKNGRLPEKVSIPSIREMLTYYQASATDWPVHALGSGVMCCRPSVINLLPASLNGSLHSGDDEDLAIWAQRHSIPMVRVASPDRLSDPNEIEWRKEPLHARQSFKTASADKLRAYTRWTLHQS